MVKSLILILFTMAVCSSIKGTLSLFLGCVHSWEMYNTSLKYFTVAMAPALVRKFSVIWYAWAIIVVSAEQYSCYFFD